MSTPTLSKKSSLRQAGSLFRVVFDHAAVGLAVLDGDGRFLEVNPRFHQMLERSADKLLGSTFDAIAHPDDSFNIKRLVRDVLRGRRQEFSREARLLRDDGRFLWVKVQVTALGPGNVRLMAVIEDIDARKQAEQELVEQERMFREMLDALPAAIYTTDAEGRVTHYNRAAANFAGLEPAVGDQWCMAWRLLYPDGQPMPQSQWPMAIALREGREVFGEEAIAVRPDGSRVWFTPYPVPLRDEHGDVVGGINMLVDITERKRIEEDLRRHRDNLQDLVDERTREVLEANARARHTERMAVIGTLSAGLGHDMANLLVPVQIRLEALS
ncbi:MAG TPA: PAS domain S-box protein, partial [Candidatus Krumholzibacteria bacterium]